MEVSLTSMFQGGVWGSAVCYRGIWTRQVYVNRNILIGGHKSHTHGQHTMQAATTPHLFFSSDVQRAICRPHVAHSNQQHIDQRPDAQPTKAEELPEAFSPLAKIEPVGSKPTQCNAEGQGC